MSTTVPAIEWIRRQISLEYQLLREDTLAPFPGSSERARFIVYAYEGGFMRFFRRDLPAELRTRLSKLSPIQAFYNPDCVRRILAEQMPCREYGLYRSYIFNRTPQSEEFPDATKDGDSWVVRRDGKIVSRAWSARDNHESAEVAVETRPEYRRRGFARQVAAAWANEVIQSGRTAFYSHSFTNRASQSLAGSLCLTRFTIVAAYD